MLQYNYHEDLFHDLTGHGCEAYWSVVPRVPLIKNGCDISSVTGDFL